MPIDTMDPVYGALHLVHILKELVILEQQTALHYYSDGGASLAELNALSAKQIEQVITRTDKKIALLAEQFGVSSVE